MSRELSRGLEPYLRETLGARRVLVLNGPRQSGKTTLARRIVDAKAQPAAFRTLDDPTLLSLAHDDPVSFVSQGPRPVVIDEVQRGGDALVLAIKREADASRTPGQFILTGSADFLTVPTISESLAGRASIHTVWPFTQAELDNRAETWIDDALNGGVAALADRTPAPMSRADLVDRLARGGFAEVQSLSRRQRRQWFADYLDTVIKRDIIDLGGVRRADQLRRMMTLLAARTGSEVVMQSILNDLEVQRQAAWSYASWLRTVFLVHDIPAWSKNLTSRVTKRPKTFVCDSGLATFLIGRDENALLDFGSPVIGALVESFVTNELLRGATWAQTPVRLFHLRQADQTEVDLLLETDDGRVVAVEIKSGQTLTHRSFRGLTRLREELGDSFVAGVVLYSGSQSHIVGDRLAALPIASLWA